MSKQRHDAILTDGLRAAIDRSGLTLYRLSQGAGVDSGNLSRFMRGQLSMTLTQADRIAAYLGLRLVADPDAPPPEPTPDNLARPMLTAKRKAKRTHRPRKRAK